VNTIQREELLDEHQHFIRAFVNQWVRGNPALTGAILAMLGMPGQDLDPTTVDLSTDEVIATLTPEGVGLIRVRCRDKNTDAAHILYLASGIVANYEVAAAPVTVFNQLTKSVMLSRCNSVMRFAPAESGQRLSIAFAWQDERGAKGNFSVILTAVIP
jgi:hypothetical protein